MEEKNFLEKLQNASDTTKRRWMVLGSIIIMAAVIYVWLAYFNNLIIGFGGAIPTANNDNTLQDGGFTFMGSVKRGTAMLFENILNGVHRLGNVLQAPREYIIKP